MAGSAINLGGMLSQMNNSLGSMGEQSGFFNPINDIIRDQAATREKERLEAARTAQIRGTQASMQEAGNVAQAATLDPSSDGRQVAAARAALQQKALDFPDQAQTFLNKDKELAALEVQLRTRGHTKGVNDIDKALADPRVPEEAKAALRQRREQLLATPGVSSAIAGAQKARLDTENAILENQLKRERVGEVADTQKAGVVSMAILNGEGTLEDLKGKVSHSVYQKVSENVSKEMATRAELEEMIISGTNLVDAGVIEKGTPEHRAYVDAANMGGVTYANKRHKENAETVGAAEVAKKIEAKDAWENSTAEEKVRRLVEGDSATEWSFAKNLSETVREYANDNPEEAATMYAEAGKAYNQVLLATGSEQDATNAASDVLSKAVGVNIDEGRGDVDKTLANNAKDSAALKSFIDSNGGMGRFNGDQAQAQAAYKDMLEQRARAKAKAGGKSWGSDTAQPRN